MIDHELRERINGKISEGKFAAAELPDLFTFFCQLSNANEEIQEEVDGWRLRIQMDLSGLGLFWIEVGDGRFTYAPGAIEEPDFTFTMAAAEGLITGEQAELLLKAPAPRPRPRPAL